MESKEEGTTTVVSRKDAGRSTAQPATWLGTRSAQLHPRMVGSLSLLHSLNVDFADIPLDSTTDLQGLRLS